MKIIQKILSIIVIFAIAGTAASFFMKKKLPEHSMLMPELQSAPIQKNGKTEPFSFDYNHTPYEVTPLAEYELWGLVVTHNDIGQWYDIYHDETSVDLKDICVVWGNNAMDGVYEKMKFKSGSWTCYWKTNDRETWQNFQSAEIANNHLLSSDLNIQAQMKNLKIGDQVHLKGYLVNYTNKTNNWTRKTSTTRTDTGGTSCEVVYVNELEVMASPNANWYLIYSVSKSAILFGILMKILLVIAEVMFSFKKVEKP